MEKIKLMVMRRLLKFCLKWLGRNFDRVMNLGYGGLSRYGIDDWFSITDKRFQFLRNHEVALIIDTNIRFYPPADPSKPADNWPTIPAITTDVPLEPKFTAPPEARISGDELYQARSSMPTPKPEEN